MKPLKHRKSLRGLEVSFDDLSKRAANYAMKGYSPAKWMQFCDEMLKLKLRVFVYEAPSSYSKYVTVLNEHGRKFRVRFSNHPPSIHKENEGNCDFFVGINNLSTATTGMAVEAAKKFFGPQLRDVVWMDEAHHFTSPMPAARFAALLNGGDE